MWMKIVICCRFKSFFLPINNATIKKGHRIFHTFVYYCCCCWFNREKNSVFSLILFQLILIFNHFDNELNDFYHEKINHIWSYSLMACLNSEWNFFFVHTKKTHTIQNNDDGFENIYCRFVFKSWIIIIIDSIHFISFNQI